MSKLRLPSTLTNAASGATGLRISDISVALICSKGTMILAYPSILDCALSNLGTIVLLAPALLTKNLSLGPRTKTAPLFNNNDSIIGKS